MDINKTKLKNSDYLKKIENYVNKISLLNEEVTPQTIQNSKYFERIKYFLDKLVQTEGGKNTKTINSIRTALEKYLSNIKDISKSSALKSFKSGVNESPNNDSEQINEAGKSNYVEKITSYIDNLIKSKLDVKKMSEDEMKDAMYKFITSKDFASKIMDYSDDLHKSPSSFFESKHKISNKDLKYLLEFIQEAEKAEKSNSDKKPDNTKQDKKSDNSKNLEKPKQDKKPEEEIVSPSNSVSALLKSSGFSNFVQDASRMSSRRDKAEAYIQMLSALPSISDAFIRKAIINKFKTKE